MTEEQERYVIVQWDAEIDALFDTNCSRPISHTRPHLYAETPRREDYEQGPDGYKAYHRDWMRVYRRLKRA